MKPKKKKQKKGEEAKEGIWLSLGIFKKAGLEFWTVFLKHIADSGSNFELPVLGSNGGSIGNQHLPPNRISTAIDPRKPEQKKEKEGKREGEREKEGGG